MSDENIPNPHRPAFPFFCQGPTTGPEFYYGLTKRELFAMSAMQAIIASKESEWKDVARDSVDMADRLIKALEVGGE